jgi:hypothetical protein
MLTRLAILASLLLSGALFAHDSGGTNDPRVSVGPGESASNKNGVTISTDADSGASASMNQGGQQHPQTCAKSKTGWHGSITETKPDDVVTLSSSAKGKIAGTGGEISIAGGSTVTVECTGGPNNEIHVTLPSGDTVTVYGGSRVKFST